MKVPIWKRVLVRLEVNSSGSEFQKFLNEQLQDEEFREQWENIQPEMDVIRAERALNTDIATMNQTLCKNIKSRKTLINTAFQIGNTWQHPKAPKNSPSNIAEAPKNAASALLEASLGEDKYFLIF